MSVQVYSSKAMRELREIISDIVTLEAKLSQMEDGGFDMTKLLDAEGLLEEAREILEDVRDQKEAACGLQCEI